MGKRPILDEGTMDTTVTKKIDVEENADLTTEWEDNHDSWHILSNVYELLHYRDNVKPNDVETVELEKIIDQHVDTINNLLHGKNRHEQEIDILKDKLFQKDQELKIMADMNKQLQDSGVYRKEVVRLESVLEKGELEIRAAKEDLITKVNRIQVLEDNLKNEYENSKKQNHEMELLRGNLSNLLDENTVLKNTAKLEKQQLQDSNELDVNGQRTLN